MCASACMVLNTSHVLGALHLEFLSRVALMALVNCSVRNCTSNKTVFPWSIMSVEGGVTVQQFNDEKVACKLPEHKEVRLNSAGLGKSKESSDAIEMSLSLESAIQLFGAFLWYYVCSDLLCK